MLSYRHTNIQTYNQLVWKPWKINGWNLLINHLETKNDLPNQTSMIMCKMLIFQGVILVKLEPPWSLTARPWKMVVRSLLSYWEGNFSPVFCVFFRPGICRSSGFNDGLCGRSGWTRGTRGNAASAVCSGENWGPRCSIWLVVSTNPFEKYYTPEN